jgi:hypothetical protein
MTMRAAPHAQRRELKASVNDALLALLARRGPVNVAQGDTGLSAVVYGASER